MQPRVATPHPILVTSGSSQDTAVVDRAGEPVGTVTSPTTKPRGQHMPYAVVALDRRLGLDDKLFIVPWQVLQLDPAHRRFVLTIPVERLVGAPCFDRERWPDLADPLLRHGVRAHYGCGPLTSRAETARTGAAPAAARRGQTY